MSRVKGQPSDRNRAGQFIITGGKTHVSIDLGDGRLWTRFQVIPVSTVCAARGRKLNWI